MSRIARVLAVAVLALVMFAAPASAGAPHYYDPLRDGPAEDGWGFHPVVDFVLTRPFGFACVVGGSAIAVSIAPFAALGDIGRPGLPYLTGASKLVTMPLRYTFVDRLGSH